MQYFSLYFLEMKFAREHFKATDKQKINFCNFLKRGIYKILTALGCSLDEGWSEIKSQVETTKTVSKVLDVSYLFKRIELL